MNLKIFQKIPRYIWISALSVLILSTIYGGTYGIIQNRLNRTGDGPDFNVEHFFIIAINEDTITIDLNISFSEPIDSRRTTFDLSDLTLHHNDTHLANIFTNPSQFLTSQTSFRVNITFHIISDDFYSILLQDLLENGFVLMNIQGKVKLSGPFVIYPKFNLDKQLNLTKSESMSDIDLFNININNITISEETLKYAFHGDLSIFNPFEFAFNITKLSGIISFDDPDGYVLIFPFKEEYDIQLTRINLDWESDPMIISPNTTETKNFTIEDNILTPSAIARLIDEVAKGRLFLNIKNAEIELEIAGFKWTIPFDIEGMVILF